MNFPNHIAFDPSGNLYIADTGNNVIRIVSAAGVIGTFAGTSVAGFSGDNGQAAAAQLSGPQGVCFTGGNLYITDTNNNRVRKVDGTGKITTFAGTGVAGLSGDNGLATSANLNPPFGITADAAGNVYVSMWHVIRKIDTTNKITTVAGTVAGFSGDGGLATAAAMDLPYGVF